MQNFQTRRKYIHVGSSTASLLSMVRKPCIYLNLASIAATAVFLTACSGQSFHEGAKASEQFECANNLPPSQYDDCMKRVNETYQELEKM